MKETQLTERFALEFGVQAFNIFNHTQLGDPHNLQLDYVPNPNDPTPSHTSPAAGKDFGVINTTNNFNNNNDNAASPKTRHGIAATDSIHAAIEVLAQDVTHGFDLQRRAEIPYDSRAH